jgi:hypothetical protein
MDASFAMGSDGAGGNSISIVAVEHGLHAYVGLRAPISKWSQRRSRQLTDVRDYLLGFNPRHVVAWLPMLEMRGVDVLGELLEMLAEQSVGSSRIEAPSLCRASPDGRLPRVEHVIDAGFLAQKRRPLRVASLRSKIEWLNEPEARPYLDASVAARGPIHPVKQAVLPLVAKLRELASVHGRVLVIGEWVAVRGLCSSVMAIGGGSKTRRPAIQRADSGGVRMRA